MKRILVPTDFSPTAERAFRVALDISEKSKGTIILYHAYKPEKNQLVSTAEAREQYNKQTEATLVKRLHRINKKVNDGTAVVSVSAVIGRTPVVDNILGFAGHNHIDLIVMGTQGASGLRKTIVGSVASRVADHAAIPVLLVPEKYEMKQLSHFVFASDYANAEKQALSQVLSLADLFKTKVTFIHLISTYLATDFKKNEAEAFDAYAFSLQSEFNKAKLKFKLMETSSIIETMENLDKTIPYDLLVLVRRNKSFYEKFFIGSFTKNMAYITRQLLLIIPQEKVLEGEGNNKNSAGILAMPHDNLQIEKLIRKKIK